jgi:TonB-linked SusC/RagA family outer membrane protein
MGSKKWIYDQENNFIKSFNPKFLLNPGCRPVDPAFQNPEQYGEGTDWYDVITRIGSIQSYNLTVSTGTEKLNTSVTAGYFNQEGVVEETGYQRFSLRINTRFQPIDKLNIGFNLAPTYATNTNFNSDGGPYGSQNIVSASLITTPLASPYNPDGSLALTASDPATFGNPNWLRVAREKVYEEEDRRILSNAFVEYEIIEGFIAKTTANIQLGNSNLFQFNPSTIGVLFTPPPRIPSGSEDSDHSFNWVNENTLTFHKEIDGHNIDALAGYTAQRFRGESIGINATNYADDKIQNISAAGQTSVTSSIQEWTLLSYLSRINYNYNSKYFFTASIRRDGSSRFGPVNRWGNFPSASVGWIVSDEDFWNLASISFLKLRASYGITGNFEIGNYSYRSSITPTNYVFGNSPFLGRATNNLGDQGLGWERNQQLNIGGDIHLFKDRIQLTYNYYSRNVSDLLFNVRVPVSSGFNNIQTNIGELKFWGHEISINTNNINKSNLSWNTNFNMSFDRNRTISLATRESLPLAHGINIYGFFSHRTEIGQPIAMFYGAIHDGVYINQEDFDSSPKHASSQVGTIKFRDWNGDGVIEFPGDMTLIGSPWPDFTFGMTNTVIINNFDASAVIVGSYGNQILPYHENWTTNLDGVFNVLEEVKDRWKSPTDPGEGKYGSVQQGTTFLERDRWHTRYIKDGSFLSFKNITLRYTLPLNENGSIRKLRLYGSIQNAFIITNYSGPNPEVNTRSNSSGSTPGVDENSYPIPRTISLGVNISF